MSHVCPADFAQLCDQELYIVNLERRTGLEDNGLQKRKMSERVTDCCQI